MRSMSKLFVAEGRLRPHKLLGLYAMGHFAYRYLAFFTGAADMGFAGSRPHRTTLALSPHLTLQLSGLRFAIPRRRIKEGSRIWPEYRWHALVFACRCLALMALALSYKSTGTDASTATRLLSSGPLLVVLLAMAAADTVSRAHVRRESQRRMHGRPIAAALTRALLRSRLPLRHRHPAATMPRR